MLNLSNQDLPPKQTHSIVSKHHLKKYKTHLEDPDPIFIIPTDVQKGHHRGTTSNFTKFEVDELNQVQRCNDRLDPVGRGEGGERGEDVKPGNRALKTV